MVEEVVRRRDAIGSVGAAPERCGRKRLGLRAVERLGRDCRVVAERRPRRRRLAA
jgi:hypothetical protein